MNIKGKVLLAVIAVAIGTAVLSKSGSDEELVVQAPTGFSYSPHNHLVPDIQVRLMTSKVRPLMYSMMNDRTGKLPEFARGYDYLISSLSVNEDVLNNRPFIEYVTSDKESVRLQPRGIHTGIQYSGRSNLDRRVFDEVAFGFLASWTGTKDPEKITEVVFGDKVNKDIGFPLSILYFQRQFLEQTGIKGFSSSSGYSPILADYNYLYNEFIAKGRSFEDDTLDSLRNKVSSNIIAITQYLREKSRDGDRRVNEKAVILLEFYLNEDMKMVKSLERDVRMITPPDNSDKESLRIKRLEEEARRRQMEANEREKAQRQNQRLSTTIRN